MPETKARRLATALDEFISSSPDVEAAAVVSFDGLPMASALPETMEEDRVGAMSAALLSLGEQAAMGLGRGQLNQVFVEGEHGYVFLMSARDQAVLAAVARHSAKIGFMLFEMRRAAERIGDVLLSTDHHPEHSPLEASFDEPAPSHEAPEPEPVHEPEPYGQTQQEPDPWHSSVPEEHDLSAAPEGDQQHDEPQVAEEFPAYRPDADRTAAPWH